MAVGRVNVVVRHCVTFALKRLFGSTHMVHDPREQSQDSGAGVDREDEDFEEEAAVKRDGVEIDGLGFVVDRGLPGHDIPYMKNVSLDTPPTGGDLCRDTLTVYGILVEQQTSVLDWGHCILLGVRGTLRPTDV